MIHHAQACGEVLLPFGDATGGHGVPGVGLIPGLLGEVPPWLLVLPGAGGFELDEPELGVELGAAFAAPGKVPQGELLGEVPVFGVLGLTVEGCVALPGVAPVGVFEPGTVVLGVPRGDVDPEVVCGVVVPAGGVAGVAGGVAVPAGGVAVLAGGVAVPAGGVAGEPGVAVCPGLPEPPAGGAPPEGAVCAIAQLAQHNTADSNANFDFDMVLKSSRLNGDRRKFLTSSDSSSVCIAIRGREYPAYAVDAAPQITEWSGGCANKTQAGARADRFLVRSAELAHSS